MSSSERRNAINSYLIEISLLAKRLCPDSMIEVTTEAFEYEDGHVRFYPPARSSEAEITDIEGKLAARCFDISVETEVLIRSAVYD